MKEVCTWGLEEWIACAVKEFIYGVILGWMLGGCGTSIRTGGCVRICLKILPAVWGGRLGAAVAGTTASSYRTKKIIHVNRKFERKEMN